MHKIALIYDTPGWAFHRVAIQVATNSAHDLHMTLIPSGDPHSRRAFHESISPNFDLCHYLWRGGVESVQQAGPTKISSAVYDHQFLDDLKFTKGLLQNIPFYVSSSKLKQEYSRIFPDRAISTLPDGVDTNFFSPRTTIGDHAKLRVGWVGNSSWGNNSTKGYHEIFVKAVDKAIGMGIPLEFEVADAVISKRTHSEMQDYYQSIDLLCCTSLTEGTPNPILEAAAAGRAWVSTDVGIVAEVAGSLQQEFIIERSVQSFINAFERLASDRALLKSLGEENREQVVENWQWSKRAHNIGEFLRLVIDN